MLSFGVYSQFPLVLPAPRVSAEGATACPERLTRGVNCFPFTSFHKMHPQLFSFHMLSFLVGFKTNRITSFHKKGGGTPSASVLRLPATKPSAHPVPLPDASRVLLGLRSLPGLHSCPQLLCVHYFLYFQLFTAYFAATKNSTILFSASSRLFSENSRSGVPPARISFVLTASPKTFLVSETDDGKRLDRFVVAHCPGLSRSRVQELIDSGLVLIDGKSAKSAQKLHTGQRITVEALQRLPLEAQPESIPLRILHEDDDFIVIDKAAGMTVHAGAGNSRGTLVNALLGRGQPLSQGGDALRPGIVHRLDKETSGVIVVAKNDAAHAKLSEAFRSRAVKKTYLALIHGRLETKHGSIRLAISRDTKNRRRMTARKGAAAGRSREAHTDWRTLAEIDGATLVEIQLHTGRTHQIRVHFAALRHPVVGDALYGAPPKITITRQTGPRSRHDTTMPTLSRNFLHAAKLAFAHPRTDAWIEAQAPLPSELREFLRTLAAAAGDDSARIDAALKGYL